ncbi:MAG: hypothetical protein JWM86_2669 [Thermoleophilia bacterium]|nr:hypothetical protein [Thermoleophilia bacterium]
MRLVVMIPRLGDSLIDLPVLPMLVPVAFYGWLVWSSEPAIRIGIAKWFAPFVPLFMLAAVGVPHLDTWGLKLMLAVSVVSSIYLSWMLGHVDLSSPDDRD